MLQDPLSRAWSCFVLVGLLLVAAEPASAQIGVVVQGRIEDAASRTPIVGALVFTADTLPPVATDSLGGFVALIPRGQPLAVEVQGFGYRFQRFEFDTEAAAQILVLLLEPQPIELEGIEVVEERAVDRVLGGLQRRRNAYDRAIAAFDRDRLSRYSAVGSAWDFISARVPGIFECAVGRSGLCVPGRGFTPANPFPENPVMVCIDGWESWAGASELGNLDLWSVALIEIYGRGRDGIRVYTAMYISAAAATGRSLDTPLSFGC